MDHIALVAAATQAMGAYEEHIGAKMAMDGE
jgi:hypothetical protein